MSRSVLSTLALLIPLLFGSACLPGKGRTQEPGVTLPVPDRLGDLDDYTAARNAYALHELDDPARLELRGRLRGFLIGYLDRALAEQRSEAAIDALEHLAGLWTPTELRNPSPDPELAAAAMRTYAAVARAGDERPALLALGLAHAFGDATARQQAEAGLLEVREWLDRTSEFADDPRVMDELDRLLEDVTSVLPTPHLVHLLETVYLERYREAQQAGGLTDARDPRITFTPYLLARLYLRADDLPGAIAAIDRLESDAATVALRDLIAAAAKTTAEDRSPVYLDQLTREFVPSPDSRLPDEIIRQSWGIVDNLSRRTLALFPDHAPAHLARGRVLRSQRLSEAAIIHYERAFASKERATDREDSFVAWTELAELYQDSLAAQAQIDPVASVAMLARVEDFHARAAELWQQRPIEPSLSVAWLTVAVAEFEAGHVESAETLLTRTIAIEPDPAALSLLGLIALRRGEFELARERLGGIEGLVFVDQVARYEWQIDSQIRLGEVERLAGNDSASAKHLREALHQLNTLLSYPGLGDGLRVDFLLRRAQAFFFLGELELGMTDYRDAQALAPELGSVYASALMFTVVHGHVDAALAILHDVLAQPAVDEDQTLYFAIWALDVAERVGRPKPTEALEFLRRYAADESHDAWLRKLAQFGLGELGDAELEAAAEGPRQRSEAFFYEGLRRWRSGSHKSGLELLAKVLEQQMLGDYEYEMAQNYLHWNDVPKTARAALVEVPPSK